MFHQITLKTAILFLALAGFTVIAAAQNCEQHQALIDKLDKAFMEKNVEALADIYHADAVRHHSQGKAEGLKKIQEEAAQFYKDVQDAEGKNLDFICSDDRIVVRWVGTGTPAGYGKKVSVTGITIYKVADGKVVEEWEEMNSLALMMQMGYELKPPAEGKE